GNVTALRLATRIIESSAGLLPDSIILAAMPPLAVSIANRDNEATKRHLRQGIYLLLSVTLPLSVWLCLVNRPLIAFLYQRAKFSAADTMLVSSLMLLSIPYLFLIRLLSLLELPFFANHNTRTPLVASATQIAVQATLSLLLISNAGIYA